MRCFILRQMGANPRSRVWLYIFKHLSRTHTQNLGYLHSLSHTCYIDSIVVRASLSHCRFVTRLSAWFSLGRQFLSQRIVLIPKIHLCVMRHRFDAVAVSPVQRLQ